MANSLAAFAGSRSIARNSRDVGRAHSAKAVREKELTAGRGMCGVAGLTVSMSVVAISTASRHRAVAPAAAASGPVAQQKSQLGIILTCLVVASIVSIPHQKWRAKRIAATTP